MATTTLTSGQRAAHEIALAASTVDTVNFPAYAGRVRVWNLTGTAAIHFVVGSATPALTDPTVDTGAAVTHMLPAAIGYKEVDVPRSVSTSTQQAAATQVKLISAGTPSYSVEEA
jgi:hypothetical protein